MLRNQYIMAFTTGGLFLRESILAAELYQSIKEWDSVKKEIIEKNLFQARTASALKRNTREVLKRLITLSDSEIEFLLDAARPDQQALLWITVCRRYSFIAEFATEVIREKYLSLNYDLEYEDFDWFLNKKADWYPKLEELTLTTRKKLRQVLFRILRDANILSSENRISPILFSSRFVELIQKRNPQELTYFPIFERDLRGIR
ncbi:MAG: hypothetical protein B6241_06730 [Spirochaetaceae bacterium 4572_59]|nr:MAG: hypothetical protein B6241_06730 [Spirochaetaceae bacterium 4572_59]